MANSKYSYVRLSELPDPLLPNTYLLLRLDGKNFHSFSASHSFSKPNDLFALQLMNAAAKRVVEGKEVNGECVLGFGESDEFSFLFRRSCRLYGRRSSKLVTLVVSLFTSAYVYLWPTYFPNSPLKMEELPTFDGRIVQYTTEQEVKDYFRWRQVDTHINNMYNTCFWSLVLQTPMSEQQAHKELSGTISSQKQELLFTKFGINYNHLPEIFKKGSLVLWETFSPTTTTATPTTPTPNPTPPTPTPESPQREEKEKELPQKKSKPRSSPKPKRTVVVAHEDLIQDSWWESGRGRGVLEG